MTSTQLNTINKSLANNSLIYNVSKYKSVNVSVRNQSGQMKRLSLTQTRMNVKNHTSNNNQGQQSGY